MILALDAGNTNIAAGCISGTDIVHIARLKSDVLRTADEYAVLLDRVLAFGGIDGRGFEGAIISSVVPPLTGTLRAAVKKLTGLGALVVGAGIKTGLNIKIDNPAQLGSDLVAAAVAAVELYTPPIIIVDIGTATTFTVIDRGLRLLGGAIVPGVGTSLAALAGATSQLPRVPVEAPRACIGTNTVDCMKSGAVFGAAAMVDGLVLRMEEELGEKTRVVATGGLGEKIVPHCRCGAVYDGELPLRGLALIYARNKK